MRTQLLVTHEKLSTREIAEIIPIKRIITHTTDNKQYITFHNYARCSKKPINTVHRTELGRRQKQAINTENITPHYGLIEEILFVKKPKTTFNALYVVLIRILILIF
jgi:hypothetical protein